MLCRHLGTATSYLNETSLKKQSILYIQGAAVRWYLPAIGTGAPIIEEVSHLLH